MTQDPAAIAGKLSAEVRSALSFFDECDLPEAENAAEIQLIDEMMKLGLVGKIIANGRVFMDIQPLGLSVRQILEEQDRGE